jgi:hypothetical protein
MTSISEMEVVIPDNLHIINLGLLKDLTNWAMSFLQQHSRINTFHQLWVMMPPDSDFARLDKANSQATQWGRKKMKALACVIFPVFAATHLYTLVSHRISFSDALFCVTELSVISPDCMVAVPYRGYNSVHRELSGGVSLSHRCFQWIPCQSMYKEDLWSL